MQAKRAERNGSLGLARLAPVASQELMTTQRTLCGAGEMVERTRAYDWSAHPLGPIAEWSDGLLTSVSMMLATPSPVQLFWGPELFQFYNDAAIPLLTDKHPLALGRRARENWQEAWPTIGPQFDRVLREGGDHLRAQFSDSGPAQRTDGGCVLDLYVWTAL